MGLHVALLMSWDRWRKQYGLLKTSIDGRDGAAETGAAATNSIVVPRNVRRFI
jgi:hypothetical protein